MHLTHRREFLNEIIKNTIYYIQSMKMYIQILKSFAILEITLIIYSILFRIIP